MHQKNALRMQQILNLSDIGNADIQRLQRRHQLVGRVFSRQEKQLLRDEERTADAEPREEQEARAASAAAALLEEESRAAASKQAKQEQRKRKQAQKRTKEQMRRPLSSQASRHELSLPDEDPSHEQEQQQQQQQRQEIPSDQNCPAKIGMPPQTEQPHQQRQSHIASCQPSPLQTEACLLQQQQQQQQQQQLLDLAGLVQSSSCQASLVAQLDVVHADMADASANATQASHVVLGQTDDADLQEASNGCSTSVRRMFSATAAEAAFNATLPPLDSTQAHSKGVSPFARASSRPHHAEMTSCKSLLPSGSIPSPSLQRQRPRSKIHSQAGSQQVRFSAICQGLSQSNPTQKHQNSGDAEAFASVNLTNSLEPTLGTCIIMLD